MRNVRNIKIKRINLKINLLKVFSVVILCTLILSAAFFGVIDFITPDRLTAFNIDELNRNNIVSYSDGEFNILDFFPSGLYNNYDTQTVFSDAALRTGEVSDSNNYFEQSYYTAKLFGIIPIKRVQVNIFPETSLIPGGMPFGVKFFTEGVIVVGLSDIETSTGTEIGRAHV